MDYTSNPVEALPGMASMWHPEQGLTVPNRVAKPKLTEADFQWAAGELVCDVPAIQAISEIEAPRGFFEDGGEPVILFERHHFHRLTGGKYSQKYPNISNPRPGGYGTYSSQHPRLQMAAALDREAALKSASWGGFQILGSNFAQAGYASVQEFINAMYSGAPAHLEALVHFIKADRRLLKAIRAHDWHTFAEIYNGPAQDAQAGTEQDYDTRIAKAFRRLTGETP